MIPRALLRCAAVGLAVASSRAFAPSAISRHDLVSLSAAAHDDAARPSSRGRRSFLDRALASSAAAAVAVFDSPRASFADDAASPKLKPLPIYLYNVLRVREATEQETRIITSGKFKDVQRANVKLAVKVTIQCSTRLAVKFMLSNFNLADSVIAASAYLKGSARVQASGAGQSAVQSLFTIVEYFDASTVENIKVDALAGKEAIVKSGLSSVRRDLDDFVSYFPPDVVDGVRAQIREENDLNYREFDASLGTILNPNP